MIMNASGCLDALAAPDVALELDAFVTKTVTPLPREGNAPTRIAETEGGMLNAIGLANPGIDAFVVEHLPQLERLEIPIWVSVGGFCTADYARSCALLDGCAGVEAIELNLSCPNVSAPEDDAARIVAAARDETSKPLYAKLSPMLPSIPAVASAVAEGGADGLSLVNTIRGCVLDERTLRPVLSTRTGGLSGEPLKAIALAAVLVCAQTVELPIVGMGGVASGRDALELIAAGASAVALGTVLFSDPDAPARVRAELAAEASSFGVENPLELRGTALRETHAAHGSPVEKVLSGASRKSCD